MNKQAHKLMVSARSILIIDHPFFGCLVMQLKLVEMPFIDTMATDGKHLFYNPDFVITEVSEQELIGIIAHEAYHCAWKHHLRMGDRELDPWNRAADYVINPDLLKVGFKLPNWVLNDPKYVGFSTEEVYNMLPQPPKQPNGGSGTEESKSGKSGQGQGQTPSSGGQKPGGKGGGQDQGTDAQGNPVAGPSHAPDPGKMGGVIPAAPQWDKNTIEAEEARWEAITRQAVNVAKAQNAGQVPGFLERLVDDLERPRVNWEANLRRYIDESIEKAYSWMSPNRRFLSSGLILPGYVSDRLKHIVSVMDTSGSITNELVNKYAAEKRALLDEGFCDKLTIIYADTIVHNVQVFERGDEVKLDPKGGGGTNFRHVMSYIIEHCDDASLILFFTDLITSDFGDDPERPLLWVVYGPNIRYERYASRVPFGETMHVED